MRFQSKAKSCHPEFISGSQHNNKLLNKEYYVYIITNKFRTTFYVGVSNDLNNRISQHNNHEGSIFTVMWSKIVDVFDPKYLYQLSNS